MPINTKEREYRAMAVMEPTEEEFIVEGYATTFDDPYPLYGDVMEQIATGALDGADMTDVIFQYDHEGMVMARIRNGSLSVTTDAHGIKIRARLDGCQQAKDLYEAIKNRLIDRMSWAFSVEEESFDYDKNLRTILKVKKMYDASAVSLPANDATDISARSYYDGVIEGKRLEQRKRKQRAIQMIMKELGNGQNQGDPETSG